MQIYYVLLYKCFSQQTLTKINHNDHSQNKVFQRGSEMDYKTQTELNNGALNCWHHWFLHVSSCHQILFNASQASWDYTQAAIFSHTITAPMYLNEKCQNLQKNQIISAFYGCSLDSDNTVK